MEECWVKGFVWERVVVDDFCDCFYVGVVGLCGEVDFECGTKWEVRGCNVGDLCVEMFVEVEEECEHCCDESERHPPCV